jgi:A/G-specific adenine glycosylase
MKNFPPERGQHFVRELLAWYVRHRRALPWRETRDPYHIWISEVMLQQTRVETVLAYYERFLQEFPTAEDLARAPLDRVLKLWEGLGYYARARNLHRAAQIVVERFDGQLPRDVHELQRLPGVGRYTAAAIASIAYGHPEPVLDGNVRRVLARLLALKDDPTQLRVERQLESWLRGLLPTDRPGEFNQALMELGAVICVPRTPRCLICPVSEVCEARRQGKQQHLPVRAKRAAKPHYDVAVGLIWQREKLLITKRPEDGLLGGLWELPSGACEPGESLIACLRRELQEELGIDVEVRPQEPIIVRHEYSHFRVTLHAFEGALKAGQRVRSPDGRPWQWVHPEELSQYAFPRATLKVFQAAGLLGTFNKRSNAQQEWEEEEEQQQLQQEE